VPGRSQRFSRPRFSGGFRRKTSWGLGPGGNGLAVSTSTVAFVGGAISAVEDGITITRIRGELLMWLDAATAIGDGYNGAFGIGKGSLSAFGVGVSAMESPIADQAWDGWLYHRFFSLAAGGPIAGGVAGDQDAVNPVTAALRVDVDVRAQRKLVPEDVIYSIIEVTEVGTAVLEVDFTSRALALLP